MDELYKAVAQFCPSSSGGMIGGNSTPPGPSGDPSSFFPSGSENENREPPGPSEGQGRAPRDALLREQGAAGRDPVYESVLAINLSCDQEQERILQKARRLLEQKGIALEDPQDVNRAVNVAMTEAWEIDIDDRLSHFRCLRRYFGTRNCTLWPDIKDQLRSLGNVLDEDD